jgi:hypothetical protein
LSSFYRPIATDHELNQGDVITGLGPGVALDDGLIPPDGLFILTPHDCEIDRWKTDDNPLQPIQAAPLFPLDWIASDERGAVREFRRFGFFYLFGPEAPHSPFESEMYADLARSLPFTAADLIAAERVASLSKLAVQALQGQLLRYHSRSELLPEMPKP